MILCRCSNVKLFIEAGLTGPNSQINIYENSSFTTLQEGHSKLDGYNLGADGQQQTRQNRQIYSEISYENIDLSVSDTLPNTDAHFDLSEILKRAVNTAREMTHLRQNSNVQFNSKYPCSICYKNVNKNQKANFCSVCQKWVHRKCNGTSEIQREYEALVDEDDTIPWQCILCSLENTASKFPFGYLSKIELHDLYRLDLPSQLQLLPSYEL